MSGVNSSAAGRRPTGLIPLCALLASALIACSSEKLFGVEAGGEPARVVVLVQGATGGQEYEHRMTLDSATGQFEILRCNGRLVACDTVDHIAGTAAADRVARLFDEAQKREFRELRANYTTELTPPDGSSTTLTIVVGERRKEVRWQAAAAIPEALGEFQCLLLYVTDLFPLCD